MPKYLEFTRSLINNYYLQLSANVSFNNNCMQLSNILEYTGFGKLWVLLQHSYVYYQSLGRQIFQKSVYRVVWWVKTPHQYSQIINKVYKISDQSSVYTVVIPCSVLGLLAAALEDFVVYELN